MLFYYTGCIKQIVPLSMCKIHIILHMHSLILAFAFKWNIQQYLMILFADSKGLWSACTSVQSDQGLLYPHMPIDTFLHGTINTVYLSTKAKFLSSHGREVALYIEKQNLLFKCWSLRSNTPWRTLYTWRFCMLDWLLQHIHNIL